MNIFWISAVTVVSSLSVLAVPQTPANPPGQTSPKPTADAPKVAPKVEQKVPDVHYAPGVTPLRQFAIPLDKNGNPDMQALERLRQERQKAAEQAERFRYNMPIKAPDPNIDYKIQVIRPNPDVDYKIRIIDPEIGNVFGVNQVNPSGPSSKPYDYFHDLKVPNVKLDAAEAKLRKYQEIVRTRRATGGRK